MDAVLMQKDGRIDRTECIHKLKELCEAYGDILGRVILFGSVARGDHTEQSDIDLYVESKNTKITTAKLEQSSRLRKFEHRLYDMYSGTEFDILAFGGKRDLLRVRKTLLWKQIEKDGVVLYDKRSEAI